ncbi:acetolactate synthase large subunit [Halobaculum sp. WSA2]|uniref:Acetolactate synthase large subunit n=1 Tax=Halobaculum saliterrae TaxID=2073113 RepID=A0A6B0STL9_9EURY|nr:acetolactate synthase large subunit [Halobaculum saliterrae]MXR42308.1 acetolactate synthase large subunit [Halobaculum saliterrae]
MQVSDLVVDCLLAEDVEYVFGLPGEELEELLFSLRDSEVTFIPVRHEQGAAFMADVHGRLTGDAGVCLATLGPGATNLITGVADAHLDKAPLVAITGQGGRERLNKESHQKLDVVHTFEPVVKWNAQLSDPEGVAESMRKAFKLAEYEKPGATHLELPEDVAAEETEDEPVPVRRPVSRPAPAEEALREAAAAVEDADRPLVLAGNGAVRADAAAALSTFVDATDVPVVSTYMGKGALPDRDERSLMTLDSGAEEAAGGAVESADCVLAVGYDIAEHDPAGWNPDREKTVVHLDSEPAEVYAHYNPDVEVIGDPSTGLARLADAVDRPSGAWCTAAHDRVYEHATRRPDPDEPLTVANALPCLRAAMADEDVLVSDVGSHKAAIARKFPVYEAGRCVISNGLASMGIGVPGGLAADLAVDANVVVGTGDGGFLMNAAELETACRLDCSFTTVVFRDDDYGLISEKQEAHRGEAFGTELGNPDLVTFAESFGVEGIRAESLTAFEDAIDGAVGGDDLTLIDVVLDG